MRSLSVSSRRRRAPDSLGDPPDVRRRCIAIARRVVRGIAALSERFPQLAEAPRPACLKINDGATLFIAFDHERGVSWPRPGRVKRRLCPKFEDPNGIALHLYFFTGEWPGQAEVSPTAVGPLFVVFDVMTARAATTRALTKAIGELLESEARRSSAKPFVT